MSVRLYLNVAFEGIGGECAGAVSIQRPGDMRGSSGRYRPISAEALAQELATLPAHPFLAGEEGVRLSLAGAQNKLPLYLERAIHAFAFWSGVVSSTWRVDLKCK